MTRFEGAIRLIAVDPGDRHCGVASFSVSQARTARCERSIEVTPATLVDLFEQDMFHKIGQVERGVLSPEPVDVFVVEQFRLYPWMAREQGYSDFPTSRLIGKLEYLAERSGTRLYLQGADIKKRSIAQVRRWVDDVPPPQRGSDPEIVRLSSGRYDFVGRNQHCRDAVAHGWYWLLNHEDSPMKGADKSR